MRILSFEYINNNRYNRFDNNSYYICHVPLHKICQFYDNGHGPLYIFYQILVYIYDDT